MTLEVVGLAAGGRGVARADGVVWFLPGALPGDRVEAVPRARHPRFIEGRVVARLEDSPDRRAPECSLQPVCGGCPWMPLGSEEQLRWKRTLVVEALRRLGGTGVAVDPTRPSPAALGYRNKVEFTLGRDEQGGPAIGLHPADPARPGLIDVGRCPIQADPANAVLATARDFLLAHAAGWIDPGRRGEPFRLVVRCSRATGQVLVVLRETTRPFPRAAELASRLVGAHPELVGVVRLRAQPRRRGGTRCVPVWGQDWIEEGWSGLRFRLPAASFIQVNGAAASLLSDVVRGMAGEIAGRSVLDLYGGVGAFGIDLARGGARVEVCEADERALRCGHDAARAAGVKDIEFLRGDVEAFLRERRKVGEDVDLVVANPPRSGLGKPVPARIAALRPSRIVLVSCDPATLARDVGRLVRLGYAPERAVPVDLFPQTSHVETVLSMTSARAREKSR